MSALPAIGPSIDYVRAAGPATLVFADDPILRARLSDEAAMAGGRVEAVERLACAPGLLGARRGTAVAIFAIGDDDGALLDPTLALIQHGAAAARFDSLVIAGADLIDIVSAGIADPRATLLIAPDDAEIAAAVARLVAPRIGAVAEPASGEDGRRLAALSEEAARIARALSALSGEADAADDDMVADPLAALAMTRAMLRLRRLRERFFDQALFADPAWDMLLDLFAARLERRHVAVSSLCIAAAVPPTTALRWIAALTARELVARYPDPDDGRRVFIALADPAADAMGRYMVSASRHIRPTGREAGTGM